MEILRKNTQKHFWIKLKMHKYALIFIKQKILILKKSF